MHPHPLRAASQMPQSMGATGQNPREPQITRHRWQQRSRKSVSLARQEGSWQEAALHTACIPFTCLLSFPSRCGRQRAEVELAVCGALGSADGAVPGLPAGGRAKPAPAAVTALVWRRQGSGRQVSPGTAPRRQRQRRAPTPARRRPAPPGPGGAPPPPLKPGRPRRLPPLLPCLPPDFQPQALRQDLPGDMGRCGMGRPEGVAVPGPREGCRCRPGMSFPPAFPPSRAESSQLLGVGLRKSPGTLGSLLLRAERWCLGLCKLCVLSPWPLRFVLLYIFKACGA